jgi:hypothetical protein
MGEKFEFWVNWTERANLTKDLGNVRCNACANDFSSDLKVRAIVYEKDFESVLETDFLSDLKVRASVWETDFLSVLETDFLNVWANDFLNVWANDFLNVWANDFLNVLANDFLNVWANDFLNVFENDFLSVFENDWIVDNLECDIKSFHIFEFKYRRTSLLLVPHAGLSCIFKTL